MILYNIYCFLLQLEIRWLPLQKPKTSKGIFFVWNIYFVTSFDDFFQDIKKGIKMGWTLKIK